MLMKETQEVLVSGSQMPTMSELKKTMRGYKRGL